MSMTSESDERMLSSGVDSPSIDDANSGATTGGNGQLKKGPWTSAEDAILVEYVNKHGEGNWNAVQKHSGLARCGKSCRLRWANHLRPDLKKGAFTPEEERRIIELHAKMGNKWARMAAELPGRTDNEIKNYWNTRIKRRQRAGLPIYPPDICMQAMNESQQNDGMNTLSSADVRHPDFIQVNNFDIPAVEFKNLELYQHSPAILDMPSGGLLDLPASSLLPQGLNSFPNKPLLSNTYHPSKRLRESETFTGLNPGISDSFLGGCQYPSDGSGQISQPFMLPSPYDHNSTCDNAMPSSFFSGSHAVLNGNPSSEPSWAMKPELPSLQNQMGSWGVPSPSSPLPFFESVDVLIQTPPDEENQTSNLNPQNSGLLDAVLYESEAKKYSKNNGCEQTSFISNAPTVSMIPNATNDFHETEWEAYDDQLSPLGHSSSSVFSESTPMSGNSFDEPHSIVTFPGCKVKEEASNLSPIYDYKIQTANQMFLSRPDFLLASNCFVPLKHPTKDGPLLKDAIGTFLGDDLNRDCKQIDMDTTSSGQGHGHGHDPCAWNAMSTV